MVSDWFFLLQATAAEKPSSSGASTSSSSLGGASKNQPKKEESYRKDEGMRRVKTEPNLQQNRASVKVEPNQHPSGTMVKTETNQQQSGTMVKTETNQQQSGTVVKAESNQNQVRTSGKMEVNRHQNRFEPYQRPGGRPAASSSQSASQSAPSVAPQQVNKVSHKEYQRRQAEQRARQPSHPSAVPSTLPMNNNSSSSKDGKQNLPPTSIAGFPGIHSKSSLPSAASQPHSASSQLLSMKTTSSTSTKPPPLAWGEQFASLRPSPTPLPTPATTTAASAVPPPPPPPSTNDDILKDMFDMPHATSKDSFFASGMMIPPPAKSAPAIVGQDSTSTSSIPASLPINSMAHGSNTNTVGEEMPADDAPPELASPRVPVERDMLVSSAKKRKRMPSISVEDKDRLSDRRGSPQVMLTKLAGGSDSDSKPVSLAGSLPGQNVKLSKIPLLDGISEKECFSRGEQSTSPAVVEVAKSQLTTDNVSPVSDEGKSKPHKSHKSHKKHKHKSKKSHKRDREARESSPPTAVVPKIKIKFGQSDTPKSVFVNPKSSSDNPQPASTSGEERLAPVKLVLNKDKSGKFKSKHH